MLNLAAFNVITQLRHTVGPQRFRSITYIREKARHILEFSDSLKVPTDDLTRFALSPSFPSIRLKMQPEREKKTVHFNKTKEIDFFLFVSLPSWVPLRA